jgi:hypothetical protein
MRDMHERWPELPWEQWKDTATTLHMWTQIVGKTRLVLSPMVNHWWHVPLYVGPRGLTTSAIPYRDETFDVEFDFIDHALLIRASSGAIRKLPLEPQSVAAFYRKYLEALRSLGISVELYGKPVEVADPIPFAEDEQHASYDSEYANRFWRVLLESSNVFQEFRSSFIGKSSPVHFFWGSFDLAVTRFSGRPAPERPGADLITREAYSHEVISVGFWPGNGGFGQAAFYCYAAPEPAGLAEQPIRPAAATYNSDLKEFVLKYDDLRTATSPESDLLEFCRSTYDSAANLAKWDRASLERSASGETATS